MPSAGNRSDGSLANPTDVITFLFLGYDAQRWSTVLLRQRRSARPFLFFWVDNAEPMRRSHRDTHSSAPAEMRPAHLGPSTSTDVPRGARWKRGRTLVFFWGSCRERRENAGQVQCNAACVSHTQGTLGSRASPAMSRYNARARSRKPHASEFRVR